MSQMKTVRFLPIVLLLSLLFGSGFFTAAAHKNPPKFNNYAYIFLGPGLNPEKNRQQIITPTFTFTVVGIDFNEKEKVIAEAKKLVDNGAQLIELCGGFGPAWIAKVSAAIDNKVPVGGVFYGPEARKPLVDLLSIESAE